jgi:hypothetical protein
MTTTNQLGVICECLVCNDFFVVISREFQNSSDVLEIQQAAQKARFSSNKKGNNSKKKGKGKGKRNKKNERRACEEALADLLVTEQEKWHRRSWTGYGRSRGGGDYSSSGLLLSSSRCPSCTEQVYEMDYQTWFETPTLEPIFSLCRAVVFHEDDDDDDEDDDKSDGKNGESSKNMTMNMPFVPFEHGPFPPLYLNRKATGKPKWILCQGIGPQSLDMDRSKSNRIYKPSLAPFNLYKKEYLQTISRFSFIDNTISSSDIDTVSLSSSSNNVIESDASIAYRKVLNQLSIVAGIFDILGGGSKSKTEAEEADHKSESEKRTEKKNDDDDVQKMLEHLFGFGVHEAAVPVAEDINSTVPKIVQKMNVDGYRALCILNKYSPLCTNGHWTKCVLELQQIRSFTF